jgi:peptidoglycan/LPS O-acetylase OafA/YrhL
MNFGGESARTSFSAALPYYLLYVNEFAPGAPFYQSWSLGIEEKFYLVWPFLAFLLFRGASSARAISTAFLIIMFLMLHLLFPRIGLINYHSILIGCLLAIAMENRTAFERMHFLGSVAWSFILLFLLITVQLAMKPLPVMLYLYPLIFGFWLVSVLMVPPVWLSWRPLTFIGERSYGIYLVHLLCIRLVKFAFPESTTIWWVSVMGLISGTLLSLFVAELLYRIIERPSIQVGRRLANVKKTAVPQTSCL